MQFYFIPQANNKLIDALFKYVCEITTITTYNKHSCRQDIDDNKWPSFVLHNENEIIYSYWHWILYIKF